MRHLGRRLVPHPILGLRTAALAAGLAALLASAAAQARDVTIRGQAMQGFGRIELRFDASTKVTLRNTGSVLVVGFAEPTSIRSEKLLAELGGYVANARRDPDRTGLRLALPRPYKANLLEAGERVFIDLLPENWAGLPPGLPPEVVAELAARARAAEETLRAEQSRRARPRGVVALRLAERPDRTRLVFEAGLGAPIRVEETGGVLEGWFEGNVGFESGGNRAKSAAGVAEFEAEDDASGVRIWLKAAPGRVLRHFIEDGSLVADLLAPEPPADTSVPTPVATAPGSERLSAPATAPGLAAETRPASPARPEPPRAAPARSVAGPAGEPFSIPLGPETPAATPAPVTATFGETAGASVLAIPFREKTAAAAFERGGRVTVVFQSAAPVAIGTEEAARRALGFESVRQDGPFSILSFGSQPERPIRLAREGTGWTILRGGISAAPPDDLLVTRAAAEDGRSEVAVALGDATAVRWLLSVDDTPLAIVPTTGRQGMATGRRFVEFSLLPTIQGVVVQPNADEVQVTLGRGGVLVSRRSGLSLSALGRGGAAGRRMPLLVSAETWSEATGGDVLARIREQVAVAAEAPRSDRSAARLALATTLLSNGLNHEAAGLLAVAAQEDPVFARGREALLMAGIAAVRARRDAAARVHLTDEILAGDPEAGLWRAVLDARARNWPQALAAIRRAEPVLSRYPDDIAGQFRLTMLRAALGAGDLEAAQAAVFALQQLPAGTVERDQSDLAEALLDEAAGRTDQALAIYERLGSSLLPAVAAESSLRLVVLGRRQARITAADAVRRLEALSLSWRGDEIELGTLAQLARLYGETGRWRDMLTLARTADARFPDHDTTRTLHDETVRRFEALFLGSDRGGIDAVEYLALYYDFREFSPAGRRGDEIVRRIADRLVELDLLDQAATLLQHQVDRRLTGLPRSIVATRLATIRLMNGKPALALAVLAGSRMAELPPPVRRLRHMIEAQAQADLTRVDLALEAIEGEDGADFDRLRAGILFGARRWREAGDAFEGLVGTRWQGKEPLAAEDRQDVVRAVLAGVMAGEWMSLDRIRAKFAAKMGDSPDATLFDALIRSRSIETPEFKAALRDASRAGSLRRFLGDWASVSDLPGEPAEEAGREAGRESAPGPG